MATILVHYSPKSWWKCNHFLNFTRAQCASMLSSLCLVSLNISYYKQVKLFTKKSQRTDNMILGIIFLANLKHTDGENNLSTLFPESRYVHIKHHLWSNGQIHIYKLGIQSLVEALSNWHCLNLSARNMSLLVLTIVSKLYHNFI